VCCARLGGRRHVVHEGGLALRTPNAGLPNQAIALERTEVEAHRIIGNAPQTGELLDRPRRSPK